MRRSGSLVIAVAAIATAAAAALAGCTTTEGDNTVLILHNEAPGDGCVVTTDNVSATRPSGIMDLALWQPGFQTFGYRLTPVVQNFAVADAANLTLVKQRTAQVLGAHVDLTFSNNNVLTDADQATLEAAGVLHFDSRFSGTIPPNNGLAVYDFGVVPAAVFDAIATKYAGATKAPPAVDVVAQVVIYGNINDGTFASEPFFYPVTACYGCMTNNAGLCASLSSSFMAHTGGACFLPQDGLVDCCDDGTGHLVCPAVAPTSGT
jgi:hypothetical protein